MECRKNASAAIIAISIALLLPLFYIVAYAGLLAPIVVVLEFPSGSAIAERRAEYRIEGQTVSRVFAPVHWLDRQLRPAYWAAKDFDRW